MKTFWQLYKKEIRFLFWPGIGLLVFNFIRLLILRSLAKLTPSFYLNNINRSPSDPGFLVEYVVRPVLAMPDNSHAYIYAALLLYVLLYEHRTRSKQQMVMLPISRSTDLVAKLGAVNTWAFLIIPMLFIEKFMIGILAKWTPIFEPVGNAGPDVLISAFGRMFIGILLLSTLVMFGYVVALLFRKFRYVIGIATVSIGYICSVYFSRSVMQLIIHYFPYERETLSLLQVYYWAPLIAPVITVFMLLVPALFLYEQYAEV